MNRSFMEMTSFQEKAAAAGGGSRDKTSKANPHDNALSALEKQVFRLHTDIDKYGKLIDQLGTGKDTVTLRASISLKKDEIQNKAQELKDRFAEANRGKSEMDMRQQERLKKSVDRCAQYLDDFKKALKLCAEREVASPPIVTSSTHVSTEDSVETESLLRQQQQQQIDRMDNMVAYNEAIIDERDTEIQGLVRDIGELNEMFQDVAVMVHDQREMIDTVETNAIVTADRVEAAKTELETAEASQRAASRKKLCLAIVAGLVVGVIGGIIILTS